MRFIRLARLASRIAASNLGELTLPYRLTFSLTNHCQARCAMCNIWQKPPVAELTLSEIDTLFTHANRFSWINLTGGEIFQRSDINDILITIIRLSRDLHLLNFPTNGFQTEEIVATVKRILADTRLPRLIVTVSMDGPPDLHEEIRGLSGLWGQALQTFRELKRLNSARFSVYLGYTIQAANLGHFASTITACKNISQEVTVDDFHVNLAHYSGHYYDNAASEALPDSSLAASELANIQRERHHRHFDPVAFIERHYHRYAQGYLSSGNVPFTCQAAAASCFIDATGMVFPCSVYDAPLGSLQEYDMNLHRLWRSAARKNLRKDIRAGNCPGCWTPCEAYQTLLANLVTLKLPSTLPGKDV